MDATYLKQGRISYTGKPDCLDCTSSVTLRRNLISSKHEPKFPVSHLTTSFLTICLACLSSNVSWSGDQGVPVEVEGGGGLNKVFDGEAGSRGPTPYLIKKTIFDRKGTPFLYFLLASIDK